MRTATARCLKKASSNSKTTPLPPQDRAQASHPLGCRNPEDLARSLFFEEDEPIRTASQLEERKVRLAVCNVDMMSDFHPDWRVQADPGADPGSEIGQAMDRLQLIDDSAPKTIILISRVLIETDISMAMRFDHLCDDGSPFTRAIGAASVV